MQVSIEKVEGYNCLVNITVDDNEAKASYEKAFRNVAKNARIDGFRKGHIPRNIIESRFGATIIQDAVNDNVNKAISDAQNAVEHEIVGRPSLTLDENIADFAKSYKFVLTFQIIPPIELKPIEDLDIKKIVSEVTDADVEKMIDTLREQQSTWKIVDNGVVGEKSLAHIDFDGTIKETGEKIEGGKASHFALNVAQDNMIPGFTKQIIGHKAGDKFTIEVTFPENYHAENLRAKEASFEIEIKDVSEKVLPEITPEFMKLYGIEDGDFEKFKAELKKNMDRELARALKSKNTQIVNEALNNAYPDAPIPPALVDYFAHNLKEQASSYFANMGIKNIDLPLDSYKDRAQKNARFVVALKNIQKANGITQASEKTIDENIALITGAYESPEDVVAMIKKDARTMENIKAQALEDDVISLILQKASKGEQKMTFSELLNRQN